MADRYHLMPLEQLFQRHVVKLDNGCWLWTGRISRKGYGQFHIRRKPIYAHRFSYMHYVGEIPAGLEIDHLCRNRACVNPEHLEPVTGLENIRRSSVVKDQCSNGHPYTEAHTHRDKNGWPHCRICSNERRRKQRQDKKNTPTL